jgi:hypothetical protein
MSLAVVLGGCATCRAHPTGCEVAGAVLVGAAIAAVGVSQSHRTTVVGPYTRPPQ